MNLNIIPGISSPETKEIALYSPSFYTACSIGGVISCGSTHLLITPVDLIKCRKQVKLNSVIL